MLKIAKELNLVTSKKVEVIEFLEFKNSIAT